MKQKALNLDYDVSVSLLEKKHYEICEDEEVIDIFLEISMKRKGGHIIIAPPGLLVIVSWVLGITTAFLLFLPSAWKTKGWVKLVIRWSSLHFQTFSFFLRHSTFFHGKFYL